MNRFFSTSPVGQHQGLAIIRMITGAFLIYHGWEVFDSETMKGYQDWEIFKNSSGQWLVYLGKGSELVAGILLLLGLYTRIGALITMTTLSYIAFFVGHGKIWYDDQHPFLFVLLALVFFFTGPGAWSLDAVLEKKKLS